MREEYEYAKWRVNDHGSPGGKHKMDLIERIAKAEAALAQKTREVEEVDRENDQLRLAAIQTKDWYDHQIAIVNGRNLELEAQVEQLGRQVAEMSKPVTDEELRFGGRIDIYPTFSREQVDSLLASRARTK